MKNYLFDSIKSNKQQNVQNSIKKNNIGIFSFIYLFGYHRGHNKGQNISKQNIEVTSRNRPKNLREKISETGKESQLMENY
ncbi:hypothetical protein BpHYR1_038283 [Brachionus plicatilis]|uniref:Uncharacterized protein n=1 Tax=Brachionus plicatilis TaxID=10195 RepID=A0A3M7PT66_BRAPC|nr:hypothetical protein BpHYR1_038283 [Brachionus plicatilis]